MNCPNCNKEVNPEWISCPHCDFHPTRCTKCDELLWIPMDAKFCPNCGTPIKHPYNKELSYHNLMNRLYMPLSNEY